MRLIISKIDGKWSNAVLSLGSHINYKVVLTGTPLPNDLRDVYNYLDFLLVRILFLPRKIRQGLKIY